MTKYILTKINREDNGISISAYKKEELLIKLRSYLKKKYEKNKCEYFNIAIKNVNSILANRYIGINNNVFNKKSEIIEVFNNDKNIDEIFAFIAVEFIESEDIDERIIYENIGLCLGFFK
ncbi:hypothetical protein QJR26_18510 (plasmid) [Clostridium baratii]